MFLDADVRLSENAISTLINTYHRNQCVISVFPYHKTEKHYEQFSFFFNLIQIAGNGTTMGVFRQHVGLYGAVILIHKDTYDSIDGHVSAQKSIVDDIALGEKLKQSKIPFKLFLGGKVISLRMYGDNFKSLFWGWTKNYATGASKTPLLIFGFVFLWVSSCVNSAILLIQSIVESNISMLLIAISLYFYWVLELFRVSHRIGDFKKTTIILFPVYLTFFVATVLVSLIKKVFRLNVTWKDRSIKLN